MRTLRPTVLSLALVLAACAGATTEAPTAGPSTEVATVDIDVDADLDTAEVISTSEATIAPGSLGADTVPPSAEVSVASLRPTQQAPSVPAARFTLRRGETLAHYARWSELPVETIAAASDLDLDGVYAVGTEISVPIDDQGLAALTTRREAHHQARAEAYLASRGGSSGTQIVQVRTGDTAWSIARDNDAIPVWLLEANNPGIDLERLRPGQELMVPRIGGGTVAAVDETEPEVDLLAGEEDINDTLIPDDEGVDGERVDEVEVEVEVETGAALDVRVLPEVIDPRQAGGE